MLHTRDLIAGTLSDNHADQIRIADAPSIYRMKTLRTSNDHVREIQHIVRDAHNILKDVNELIAHYKLIALIKCSL